MLLIYYTTVIRGNFAHLFVIFHAHVNAKAVIIRVQKNPKKNIKAQTILNTLRKKNIQNKNAKKMKKNKRKTVLPKCQSGATSLTSPGQLRSLVRGNFAH